MPSATDHLRRAHRHFQVAEKFAEDPAARGWAGVVIFYAAHQLAHAVFAADPGLRDVCRHPENHTDPDLARPGTNAVIKRHYRTIEIEYMDLYGVSLGVRYRGQRVKEDRLAELFGDFTQVCRWAGSGLEGWGCPVPEWVHLLRGS